MKKVVNGDSCNLSRRHGGRGQHDVKSAYNSHHLDERADSEGRESLHAHLVISLYMSSQSLAVYKNHILTLLYPTHRSHNPNHRKEQHRKTSKNSRLNALSPPKSSQPSSPNLPPSPVSHSRNTLQRLGINLYTQIGWDQVI